MAAAAAPPRTRWLILVLATITLVASSTAQAMPGAIAPVLMPGLGISRAELGLLTAAVWGGMLFTAFGAGMLIDRLGERLVLGVGTVAIGVFVLAGSQAPSYFVLLGLLLLAGFASGASGPGGSRSVTVWFPPRLRGRAMGVRQGGSAIGGVLAAFGLPLIATHLGFRAAEAAAGGLVIMLGVAFAFGYRGREDSQFRRPVSGSLALLGDRRFQLATMFGLVFTGVAGTCVTHLAVSSAERADLDPVEAGVVLGLFQLGGFSGRLIWGWISDLMGRREPVLIAMSLAAAGLMVLLSRLGPAPISVWAGAALLLGFCGHGWSGIYLAAVAEVVPVEIAASATGLSLTIAMFGMFVIPPLFGAVVDHSGYPIAWLGLAIWGGLGCVIASALWRSGAEAAELPAYRAVG